MPPADGEVSDAVRAERLVSLFHRPTSAFASFEGVDGSVLPEPFRRLLDHASHMTVAMERFYDGPVGVVVVAVRGDNGSSVDGRDWYEREILLRTAADQVIQHGIVRIDLHCVPSPVAEEIRRGGIPLGRILIGAGMLLEVQRVGLLGVAAGPELRFLFDAKPASIPAVCRTFGRVAEIAIGGVPAVELLEIVAPGPLPKVLR